MLVMKKLQPLKLTSKMMMLWLISYRIVLLIWQVGAVKLLLGLVAWTTDLDLVTKVAFDHSGVADVTKKCSMVKRVSCMVKRGLAAT